MKPKTVTVNLSRKFNLGNFESIEISTFLSAEVELGEDIQASVICLTEMAKEAIAESLEGEVKQRQIWTKKTKKENKSLQKENENITYYDDESMAEFQRNSFFDDNEIDDDYEQHYPDELF